MIDFPVFLADGAAPFGAVRKLHPQHQPTEMTVYIEGTGDLAIPLAAVEKVVENRVVVRWDALDPAVQACIARAMDEEDLPPRLGTTPAERYDGEDDDGRRIYDGPRVVSPPGELPGRDVGSRFGAPPSITTPRR